MIRTACLAAASLLPLLSTASARAADEPKYLITCATVAPEGSTWMVVLKEMDKEVRKRTRGDVGFRFYAGGTLGQEKTVVEKIRGGQINSAGLTGIGLGELYPDLRVLEVMQLFHNEAEYDHVVSKLRKRFLKALYQRGYVLLGMTEGGFAYLYSNAPIRTLGDLRQRKIWLRSGDPLLAETHKGLGLGSVPLPLSDVLTSLQTNHLETVYVSPLALRALQWSGDVKHMLDMPLFNIVAALVYSKAEFKKLPAAYQKVLRLVCHKHIKNLTKVGRGDNTTSMASIRKRVQVARPDAAALQAFRAAFAKVGDTMSGKVYSREIYEEVKALLAAWRAENPPK